MKKLIILPLVLFLLAFSISAEPTHYYKIELNYDNGEISYLSIAILPSEKRLENRGFTHIAEILSVENKAINVTLFGFPLTRISTFVNPETGLIESEQTTYFNQSKTTLYLPYYHNAKQINIYDLNLTKKLTIPVSQFSQIESDIQINEINGLEESEDKTIQNKSIKKVIIPISFILILLTIIIVIVILKNKKNKS